MNIAVFRTGKHTAMNGSVHDWTEQDIDRIISNYDPEKHTAPAVIGHPKSDHPAWGWVKGLSRIGDTLYAEFDQIHPDFADMLKTGLFKKRSISLYPDLTLKHVGFLGAAPPAVKGLPDYKFSDGANDIIIEFSTEQKKENPPMELKEFFEALKFWKEATTVETPAPALPPVQPVHVAPVVQELPATVSFSEADMEAAKKQAAKEAAEAERQKVMAEFAEANQKVQRAARTAMITAEVDQMINTGKAIPAWKKAGLVEFMCGLDAETDIQFSEGDEKDNGKKNQLAWFRDFMAGLPKVVNFTEVAKSATSIYGDAADKLTNLIDKKLADNTAMSYTDAFNAVQMEHPELALEFINQRL